MSRPWTTTAVALGLLPLIGMSPASAQDPPPSVGKIEIREIEWGFDGKAPLRMFVPLSLLIENPGPTPASGTLRLSKSLGLNQRVDADYEQAYFVSGFSARWVQLTPFVLGDYESWTVAWGPEFRNRVDVPSPRVGERATVLFADPDDATAAGSVLRRCDPALFPASVTATDSLRGAVLHAAPNWQGARVQAFREWVRRGGKVFIVHGSDGEYPQFPGELAFLNDDRDEFPYGAGRVTRLPLSLDEIDAETAQQLILKDRRSVAPPDLLDARKLELQRLSQLPIWTDFHTHVFRELLRTTRFHRNWWLVYSTAVLYVLAVFPGSYLLGRRVSDWRWFYAGFVGLSVVFSTGFSWMGQLGSADRSRMRSVAAAYQLEDGLYDVTQWTCAASRRGDRYQLTNPGSGRLYSSCQEIEPVNGVVRLQDGRFDLDLPSAATCNILQRSRMAGPPLGVRVIDLQANDFTLQSLKLTWGAGVYDADMIVGAWYRDRVYQLTAAPDGAQLAALQQIGSQFINSIDTLPFKDEPGTRYSRWGRGWGWGWAAAFDVESVQPTRTELFQMLMQPVTGATLQLSSSATQQDVVLDTSVVRVLIYRPMPPAFLTAGEQFPDQQGYVLYVVDLPSSAQAPQL